MGANKGIFAPSLPALLLFLAITGAVNLLQLSKVCSLIFLLHTIRYFGLVIDPRRKAKPRFPSFSACLFCDREGGGWNSGTWILDSGPI